MQFTSLYLTGARTTDALAAQFHLRKVLLAKVLAFYTANRPIRHWVHSPDDPNREFLLLLYAACGNVGEVLEPNWAFCDSAQDQTTGTAELEQELERAAKELAQSENPMPAHYTAVKRSDPKKYGAPYVQRAIRARDEIERLVRTYGGNILISGTNSRSAIFAMENPALFCEERIEDAISFLFSPNNRGRYAACEVKQFSLEGNGPYKPRHLMSIMGNPST